MIKFTEVWEERTWIYFHMKYGIKGSKILFGMLDAIMNIVFIHAYNCTGILNYVKHETLNIVICHISKFPQDGRISEHLEYMLG